MPRLILQYLPQLSIGIKLVMRAFAPFSNAQSNQFHQLIRIELVLEAFNMCVRVRSALSIDSNHRRAQNLNAGCARCSASSFLFRGFKCCAPHPHSVRCIAIRDAANCTASRGLRWPHAPQRRPVAISRSCHCILARKLVTGQWLSILLVLVSSVLILLVHAILAHATQKPNAAT